MSLIVTLLTILVIVAIVYLILYLFSKYVVPIDQKVLGIIIFVLAAVLIIYAITGHSFVWWKV